MKDKDEIPTPPCQQAGGRMPTWLYFSDWWITIIYPDDMYNPINAH